MSAHTPGPWVVSEYMDDGRLGVLSNDNKILCAVSVGLREPDARLIAAAPDMAETLTRINTLACYASEENTDSREAVLLQIGTLARAALAKAGVA